MIEQWNIVIVDILGMVMLYSKLLWLYVIDELEAVTMNAHKWLLYDFSK